MKLSQTRIFRCGLQLVDKLDRGPESSLRVLTYHRIDHPDTRPDLDPSLISATPSQFERQILWLQRSFNLVSGCEVVKAAIGEATLPRRSLLITFDDAYQDFLTNAMPVLTRHCIPAVMFVPTAYPNSELRAFWWDLLYSGIVSSGFTGTITCDLGKFPVRDDLSRRQEFRRLKQLLKTLPHDDTLRIVAELNTKTMATSPGRAVMNWDELRQVHRSGILLAPHTHTHPLMSRITLAEARSEVQQSCEMLEREIGECPPLFAYPSGHFTDPTSSLLNDLGIVAAFTTLRGINDLATDNVHTLRRNNVGRGTPDELIWAQLIDPMRWINPRMPKAWPAPIPRLSAAMNVA